MDSLGMGREPEPGSWWEETTFLKLPRGDKFNP
jgi:hypothetical protein